VAPGEQAPYQPRPLRGAPLRAPTPRMVLEPSGALLRGPWGPVTIHGRPPRPRTGAPMAPGVWTLELPSWWQLLYAFGVIPGAARS
jgi:hypothetical protein